MAFQLATVTAFIASLSMTGVTIKDLSTMPNSFDIRQFPILAPEVFQPVTMQRNIHDSYGDGTTAKQSLYYLVPYVLACYDQGEGRGLQDILPGIASATSTVITSLLKNDTPADLVVDLAVQSATVNTIVNDPAGKGYHGAKLILLIREYVEGIP